MLKQNFCSDSDNKLQVKLVKSLFYIKSWNSIFLQIIFTQNQNSRFVRFYIQCHEIYDEYEVKQKIY